MPIRRCYECFRPMESCFCASIPRIDNRTEVLILQHWRERFHPFNTARIVHKGLRNSQLLADHTQNLAARLQFHPQAGLLFPGPTAKLISDLAPEERPQQLVVLDGTWHHAKTFMRDIPALRLLPRYQLAPLSPSRYRIRREPNETALSTVEAAVAALKALEPETVGLDQLLQAFDTMIDAQLARSDGAKGGRFRARRRRTLENIPLALTGDLQNVVVAYGESAAGERGIKSREMPPVSWVAQRLGDGETFACTMIPPHPLEDTFLGHLELPRSRFADAVSLDEARRRWEQFHRTTDVIVVLRPGTARLISYLGGDRNAVLVLKSINLPLDENPPAEISHPAFTNFGRAGKRLATAIAYVRQLHDLANLWKEEQQPSFRSMTT